MLAELSERRGKTFQWRKIDAVLLVTLVVGFLLCLHGSEWGRVESWNPDQMALGAVDSGGDAFVPRPHGFLKPPFHSYVNHFVSWLPNKLAKKVFGYTEKERNMYRMRTSRMVTTVMFLATIVLSYFILLDFFGITCARVLSALFATSAGYVAYAHFLTTDIPVLFWMIAAFLFATRILGRYRYRDYVWAGLLTGLATATKYNGLSVGIAFVAAHYLREEPKTVRDWWRASVNGPLVLGLACVVLGFVLGNPYAVIEFGRFVTEFSYNYATTPIYGGQAGGTSYLDFLSRAAEFYGWPLCVLFVVALALSCFRSFREGLLTRSSKFILLALCVFSLYYAKFGAFPRMETRFTIPAFPFLVLATGPFWAGLRGRKAYALAAPFVVYGLVCSVLVGARFADDPRMLAQEWVARTVADNATIESTTYVPGWDKLPGVAVHRIQAPAVSPRAKLFRSILEDPALSELAAEYERDDAGRWYNVENLVKRNPDYAAINSLFYGQFSDGLGARSFPEIRAYFADLLDGNMPYRMVFDAETEPPPWWTYPRDIDFLVNRMTIFERAGEKS